jgi:RNA polymerase sigma-70 factor, ECF subfamily
LAEERWMDQREPSLERAASSGEAGVLSDRPLGSDRQPSAALDLTALVVAHHAPLYRYAYRLCGCAAEAEDLTQQAFLIAQRKLHQLREPERAGAWLYAVLRNCFLKSLRRQRPASAAALNLTVEEFAGPTPETDEIDREQLAQALANLPEEFRVVVLMFYFEELSYHEISEQLEIPIGTVMSRLSRAKGHLRRRLEPTSPVSPASRAASTKPGSFESSVTNSKKSASRIVTSHERN